MVAARALGTLVRLVLVLKRLDQYVVLGFSLSWSTDGYPTKSGSSSRSQAPFPRCYKSLLDLVTRSDWSISTAPRPRWKISGLSEGGMAFVRPTVTDHGADRGAPFTSRAHLQSMVISALLHGFLLRHLSLLAGLLLIYLHLISARPVRPVSSAPALIHLRAAEAHSTSLCCLIHHNRLLAKQFRGRRSRDLRPPRRRSAPAGASLRETAPLSSLGFVKSFSTN